MEEVGASRTNLCWLARRREAAVRRAKLRRLQQVKRRRAFVKRQCYERLMFVVILAATFTNSPERKMWAKERSCHWRDRVDSFTRQEWLENFHMSHDTFLFLCDKLQSAISKEDTNMRNIRIWGRYEYEEGNTSRTLTCDDVMVFVYWSRLQDCRSSVWCVKIVCVCSYQTCYHLYC